MKIAIPTNDKVTVSDSLIKSHWVKVFEFESEYIIEETIHKNPTSKTGVTSIHLFFTQLGYMLADCDAILVHEKDPIKSDLFSSHNLNEVRTREKFLTNAVMRQNTRMVNYYSNRCCSP